MPRGYPVAKRSNVAPTMAAPTPHIVAVLRETEPAEDVSERDCTAEYTKFSRKPHEAMPPLPTRMPNREMIASTVGILVAMSVRLNSSSMPNALNKVKWSNLYAFAMMPHSYNQQLSL